MTAGPVVVLGADGDWAAAIGVWLELIAGVVAATWLASGIRWSAPARPLRPLPHAANL